MDSAENPSLAWRNIAPAHPRVQGQRQLVETFGQTRAPGRIIDRRFSAILDTGRLVRYFSCNWNLIQSGGGIGPSKPQQPRPQYGTQVLIPAPGIGGKDKVRLFETSSYLA
jgi:hypothetical protein